MNVKIVFNGHEYSNVEAMPPDVRQEYEVTLDLLGKTSDRGMISQLLDAVGLKVQATIRRKIVINGKEYASVDALPPELRQRFEQAVAVHASNRAGSGASRTVPSPPPPVVPDDQARRSPLVRIAWWVALGAVLALWLLRRG
ncbi:MAG TPA: hypothetical protein VH158_06650 [Gemmatimonadales bacterium]|jgi:hypothetical protein|nr:hypothetical protein [Gemmatimonadales bacterium]